MWSINLLFLSLFILIFEYIYMRVCIYYMKRICSYSNSISIMNEFFRPEFVVWPDWSCVNVIWASDTKFYKSNVSV